MKPLRGSEVAELQKLPQLLAVMTAMGCPNARVGALIEKLAVKTKARLEESEDKENVENGNLNKGSLLVPAVPRISIVPASFAILQHIV